MNKNAKKHKHDNEGLWLFIDNVINLFKINSINFHFYHMRKSINITYFYLKFKKS